MRIIPTENDISAITNAVAYTNEVDSGWADLLTEHEWTGALRLLDDAIKGGQFWIITRLAEFITILDEDRIPDRTYDAGVVEHLVRCAWGERGKISFVEIAASLRRLYGLDDTALGIDSEFKDKLLNDVPSRSLNIGTSYLYNMVTLFPNNPRLQEYIQQWWSQLKINLPVMKSEQPGQKLWEMANARLIRPTQFLELADAGTVFTDQVDYMNYIRTTGVRRKGFISKYEDVLETAAGLKVLFAPEVNIDNNGRIIFGSESDESKQSVQLLPGQLNY